MARIVRLAERELLDERATAGAPCPDGVAGAFAPPFAAADDCSRWVTFHGNLITYLRLKGIVPPSTARRGGR